MGRRGPQRKPSVIKEAAGNPGRRTLNDLEPVVPPGTPDPPNWLEGEARKIWFQMAPILTGMKVLTLADAAAFARYCEAQARYIELSRFLMRKGPGGTTYKITRKGGGGVFYQEIPQAAEFRNLRDALIKLEREFGLTPASRSMIKVVPPPTTSEKVSTDLAATGPLAFLSGGGPKPARA